MLYIYNIFHTAYYFAHSGNRAFPIAATGFRTLSQQDSIVVTTSLEILPQFKASYPRHSAYVQYSTCEVMVVFSNT